jgi:hypothetical protein
VQCPSKYITATLFACSDASKHSPAVLSLTRALPDDLFCGHNVLGKVLLLCAAANDTQFMRRLWDIGAAGLSDCKIGWPGLQNPGTHYCRHSGRAELGAPSAAAGRGMGGRGRKHGR